MRLFHVLLSVCAAAAPAAALQGLRPGDSPRFERLTDTGNRGVVTLGFRATDYEHLALRHEAGLPFALDALPLPGGTTVPLELRPVSAMAPGARAVVVEADGTTSYVEPSVRCFAGYALDGGSAFLGLSETELHGYVHSGGELYLVSSGANGPGRATVAHVSQLGTFDGGACESIAKILATEEREPDGVVRATTGAALRTADVFIEADNVFRSRFDTDRACVDYSLLLLTAASEIYRRDIGARFNVPDGYLRVWKTTPPWGVITGFRSLSNVYDWWLSAANPLKSIPRAAVHVFTSPAFGGTSRGVDGLCVNNRAYEISGLTGSFPYPIEHTSRYNWDLFVVCHEFGHTFGSPHSELYKPPIECADGSGPDSGTIMSYCHTTYGMARVGIRFHYREQGRIRNAIASDACLRIAPLTPGDYDGNGAADEGDLSALRSVLAQGFRSAAAEEVFDLDANGVLDDADHDLVAQLVYKAPPARILPRFGLGINPPCLEALSSPLLGTVWRAAILAPGVGSQTLLVGYDQPLDGYVTGRGELLVKTAPLGGTKLFSTTATSDGVRAVHEVPLPLDPLLFGRQVSFQALIVDGPSGDQYCNALDVILSPYE